MVTDIAIIEGLTMASVRAIRRQVLAWYISQWRMP